MKRTEGDHRRRAPLNLLVFLQEHLFRDEGVAGSNPATPTNPIKDLTYFLFLLYLALGPITDRNEARGICDVFRHDAVGDEAAARA